MARNQTRYLLHRLEAGAQGAPPPAFQKLARRPPTSSFKHGRPARDGHQTCPYIKSL
jgi:hypothetical protein